MEKTFNYIQTKIFEEDIHIWDFDSNEVRTLRLTDIAMIEVDSIINRYNHYNDSNNRRTFWSKCLYC